MTWEAYNEVVNSHHQARLSHELIAAAASYAAMKAWDDHKAAQGEAVDHARRNEIMAAAAGFFIDRMVETKGLDYIDRHRARQHAEGLYAQPAYNSPAYGYAAPVLGNQPYGYAPAPAYGNQPYYGYSGYDNQSYEHEHHHHHGHHHHHHHHHD